MDKASKLSPLEKLQREQELFADVTEIENPTLQESVFLQKYLRLFVYRPDNPIADIPLGLWVSEVSGNALAEVDIINPKNEVLYTIPPLIDPNADLISGDTPTGFGEIIATAAAKSESHPVLGENYFSGYMDKVINANNPVNFKIARRWNDIFARYDLPLLPLGDKTTETTQTEDLTFEKEDF